MARMTDVAREAGVSVATVSHLLNGTRYVSPEVAQRVNAAIERLGYRPNRVAKSLREDRTRSFGLALPDVSNPFFASVLKGVQAALAREDFAVLVADAANDPALERINLEGLLERRVDGLLIVPVGGEPALPRQQGCAAVAIDRMPRDWKGSAVLSEHGVGGALAAEHLGELGHRKVAVIAGRAEITSASERLDGFLKAAHRLGFEGRAEWRLRAPFTIAGGEEAARRLLGNPGFTAVVCGNDAVAVGVMQVLRSAGVIVPDEVSVVGCDDSLLARLAQPSLTTIAQDAEKLGRCAVELLREAIAGGPSRQIRLPVKLVRRASTAAASDGDGR
jgi:LacI family transcriptional regulator